MSAAAADRRRPSICLLSRQRVVGRTNGSSTYLLSIVEALTEAGFDVHYLCPSPAVFGRMPVLTLKPEMDIFRSVSIRGSFRVGRRIVARDPRIAWRAGLTVLQRLAAKAGLRLGPPVKPAPYAIGVPWQAEDFSYVAAQSQGRCDGVLADYVFLAEGAAHCGDGHAPSAIVMHDLFSSRESQFAAAGTREALSDLTFAQEIALLAQADAVVAIQATEAETIRAALPPDRQVILAPMAVRTVAAPQPGEGQRLLFVGSAAAPNVLGMRWFLDSVWPLILAARPEAELAVAGTIAQAFPEGAPRVRFLGLVDDLDPLYREAPVVISPLHIGSGLKIKLIEAMGHGKPVVGTTVTVQGVEDEVRGGLVVADAPEDFARAVLAFLDDPALRRDYAARALAIAAGRFSAAACYRDLVEFYRRSLEAAPAARSDDRPLGVVAAS
ncbi:glycosyltransferase family 4 protein [Roseomonas sp. OT10]|uniref:glycosyltransferase n=1 Tax=Roseomonas cutis TaxID=2897332 RepID=UPI001E3FD157|nr:glycosyltransferase family 4 protein [Roseomonas sp. OT10]UFN49508.1 glycosyltransferase family 4 protein [Roseomonas sp. OT10]